MSSKIEWLCLIDMACPVKSECWSVQQEKIGGFSLPGDRDQSSLNITSGLEGTLCQNQEWNSDHIVAGVFTLARRVEAIPLFCSSSSSIPCSKFRLYMCKYQGLKNLLKEKEILIAGESKLRDLRQLRQLRQEGFDELKSSQK